MNRPEPPHAAPDGYEWVAATSPEWRPASGRYHKCRWTAGREAACPNEPVAELNRTMFAGGVLRDVWWAYCGEGHMYGRWIEDGRVVHWALREVGSDA